MNDKFLEISSSKIAILESLLAIGVIYAGSKTNDNVARTASLATAIYLAYGAYLNTQGRVKILKG